MFKRFGLIAALCCCMVTGFVAGRATADQPHMQNALRALDNARDELELADPNKGGHRDRAIELINDARREVKLGIDAAR